VGGRLVVRGRRVEKILLGEGEEGVKAKAYLACLPPERLARWLEEKFWSRRYHRKLRGSMPGRMRPRPFRSGWRIRSSSLAIRRDR
jgi:hypothetical protein